MKYTFTFIILFATSFFVSAQFAWHSKWISIDNDNKLVYHADEQGNTIPDFSRVGYNQGEEPPYVSVQIELTPQGGDEKERIQSAINKLAKLQLNDKGFRGCLLLKKGIYKVSDQITIPASGIVIRGEGNGKDGTVVVATGTKQYNLFQVEGTGGREELSNSRVEINMDFVPVGATRLAVKNASSFKKGDAFIVFRPGTQAWITDLKMDQIPPNTEGGVLKQWTPEGYNLNYERTVVAVTNDTIVLDNPIVMQMETKYGGGFVYKYSFNGRIHNCGIENILLKSDYKSETDEEHGWNAIFITRAQNCWVRDVEAKHFGYSAVNVSYLASNVSVLNCKSIEPKSKIDGGRRYSFNCDGQLNLFKDCEATEGRHDYVTGAIVCGPNVFTNCKAKNAQNDIGPHHRWATGTLYDMVITDGRIRAQDRGNLGSGHGWAGVTQVFWNCTANEFCIQSPWVSGKNYWISCRGKEMDGFFSGRPDGEIEGINKSNLLPQSLYQAQFLTKED